METQFSHPQSPQMFMVGCVKFPDTWPEIKGSNGEGQVSVPIVIGISLTQQAQISDIGAVVRFRIITFCVSGGG